MAKLCASELRANGDAPGVADVRAGGGPTPPGAVLKGEPPAPRTSGYGGGGAPGPTEARP